MTPSSLVEMYPHTAVSLRMEAKCSIDYSEDLYQTTRFTSLQTVLNVRRLGSLESRDLMFMLFINEQMHNPYFTQLYDIKALKTPMCFDGLTVIGHSS